MHQTMPDQLQRFPSLEGVRLDRDIVIKIIASCLLATALGVSTAAQAETIYLKCDGSGVSVVVSVDLTNHTVDNRPANITVAAIDWRYKQPVNDGSAMGETHWYIDRGAGTFTLNSTVFLPDGRTLSIPPATGTCAKVSMPATRF
jgi:hypothetical protein